MAKLQKLFESLKVSIPIEFDEQVGWQEQQMNLMSDFVNFCMKELNLAAERMPKIIIMFVGDGEMTTAAYLPNDLIVKARAGGRMFIDCCRSVAHELVHHWQMENGLINGPIQDVGGPEENQANAVAGSLVKKFTYDKGKDVVYAF